MCSQSLKSTRNAEEEIAPVPWRKDSCTKYGCSGHLTTGLRCRKMEACQGHQPATFQRDYKRCIADSLTVSPGPHFSHTAAKSPELQRLMKRRERAWLIAFKLLTHWDIAYAAMVSLRTACAFSSSGSSLTLQQAWAHQLVCNATRLSEA